MFDCLCKNFDVKKFEKFIHCKWLEDQAMLALGILGGMEVGLSKATREQPSETAKGTVGSMRWSTAGDSWATRSEGEASLAMMQCVQKGSLLCHERAIVVVVVGC
jgi:hypothetical protein